MTKEEARKAIEALKEPKQEELTLEKAIDFLTETGWLPNHDRELKEPKQGEWIWKKDEDALRTYDLLCSECGYKIFTCENYDNIEQAKKVVDDKIREGKILFPFCPNCGDSMRVKNELNRVSKELNSKTEYKAKVKELENAIAKCEKAEEEFKKRTCKFKSPTNCDFCSFHSDCDEHWKEGDEK